MATNGLTDSRSSRLVAGAQFIGVGLAFVGEAAALAALGWWLDRRYGTAPWATVAGVLIGVVSATWTLLVMVTRFERNAAQQARRSHDESEYEKRGSRE